MTMLEHDTARALAAAIELAEQDYAVFPCRLTNNPRTNKTPKTPHGFKDATSDPDSVRDLWQRYPGALVGVATGPRSYIAVVDVDAKHQSALDWYARHEARLQPTRTHRTHSGGLHLVFGDCEGIKCTVSQIATGVDTRGIGGYIIWWPAAGLPVLSDAPIAPWPEFLDGLISPVSSPSRQVNRTPERHYQMTSGAPPALVLRRALGLAARVASASEGERNAILYWAVRRARDMIEAGAIDRVAGAGLVDTLHEAAASAGLNSREITATIHSALRASA